MKLNLQEQAVQVMVDGLTRQLASLSDDLEYERGVTGRLVNENRALLEASDELRKELNERHAEDECARPHYPPMNLITAVQIVRAVGPYVLEALGISSVRNPDTAANPFLAENGTPPVVFGLKEAKAAVDKARADGQLKF